MAPQQPSRDPFDVEQFGPVSRALGRVARIHRATAGELLRSTGLYPGQELLMMHLWEAGAVRRRAVLVEATETSRALRPEIEAAWKTVEQRTVAGLDPAERAELQRLLEKVAVNFLPQDVT
jgi:hypothetical protein